MVKQKLLDSHPVWNQLLASVGSGIVLSTIDLESVTLPEMFGCDLPTFAIIGAGSALRKASFF
jgi:hypothetical protein